MKRTMRLTLLMAVPMLALAGVVLYLLLAGGESASMPESKPLARAVEPGLSSEDETPPDAGSDDGDAPGQASPTSPGVERKPTFRPVSYKTRMDDPLRLPKSDEEIAWFDAHGYPSSEAYDEASRSFGEAEFFDRSTPLTALNIARAELYATAFPGEAATAMAFLEKAAASGSTYALEALSRVHSNPTFGHPITSAAYLFAAELRGNWALASLRPQLAPDQRLLADMYAHEIIAEINRARRAAGRPELGFSPRPGLGDLRRQIEAGALTGGTPGDE